VSVEVEVSECGEGEHLPLWDRFHSERRLAVMPEEIDDADGGWQFDQALLEPREKVLDLSGLGVCLLARHLAKA
jgi:hypothetical protein